jgi:hypothetical protein
MPHLYHAQQAEKRFLCVSRAATVDGWAGLSVLERAVFACPVGQLRQIRRREQLTSETNENILVAL